MAYDVGDVVRVGNYSGASLSDAFRSIAGVATDPTAVTLTIDKPDGSELVYGWPSAGLDGTLSRESAGRFYFDVPVTVAGLWEYTLVGTGAAAAAATTRFIARSRIT